MNSGPLFGTRQQTRQREAPERTVAPVGGSRFVRAPSRSGVGANAQRLADSLGRLNRSLIAFGTATNEYERRRQNDPNTVENQEFIDSLYGKSFDELGQMDPESLTRVQRRALYDLLGEKAAGDFRRSVLQSTADNEQLSYEDMEERRREAGASLPDEAQRSFDRGSIPITERAGIAEYKRQAEEGQMAVQAGAVDKADRVVEEAISSGGDYETAGASVHNMLRERQKLGLLTAEQSRETLYAVAVQAADAGNYELVKQLLGDKPDGTPGLQDHPKWTVRSTALLNRAQTIGLNEDADEQSYAARAVMSAAAKGELTEDDLAEYREKFPWMKQSWLNGQWLKAEGVRNRSALARLKALDEEGDKRASLMAKKMYRDGIRQSYEAGEAADLSKIHWPDEKGNIKEMTDAEMEAMFTANAVEDADMIENEMRRHAEETGEPVNETDIRAARRLAKKPMLQYGGYKDKEFAQELRAFAAQANNLGLIDGNAEIDQPMLEMFEYIMDMHVQDPRWVNTHLPDSDAEQFFADARQMYEDNPQQGVRAALIYANNLRESRALGGKYAMPAKKDIDAVFEAFAEAEGIDVEDLSINDKQTITNYYIREHMFKGPEYAMKTAVDRMSRETMTVNGVRLKVRGQAVPSDFERRAEIGLVNLYTRNKEALEAAGFEDATQLSIRPTGMEGQFFVISSVTGQPVTAPGFNPRITMAEINESTSTIDREERARAFNEELIALEQQKRLDFPREDDAFFEDDTIPVPEGAVTPDTVDKTLEAQRDEAASAAIQEAEVRRAADEANTPEAQAAARQMELKLQRTIRLWTERTANENRLVEVLDSNGQTVWVSRIDGTIYTPSFSEQEWKKTNKRVGGKVWKSPEGGLIFPD